MEQLLPYGRAPLRVELGTRHIEVIRPVPLPVPATIEQLLEAALAVPIEAPSLAAFARPNMRITLIVSDTTRDEPRGAFVEAIRAQLPDARWTLAVATGTHGPCRVDALGIPTRFLDGIRVINHDGHDMRDLVDLGTTARGTAVRVHRCVVESDLVIATGCIRPHYFAGFGAGIKAIFPGLGEATAIRSNHRLKTEPGARAGIIDGNPCRADLEEAVERVQTPTFLVNGVCGADNAVHAVVAGHRLHAFRRGAELARPWFSVRARPASLVIASDVLPVTASLYQAAKIAAAAAPLVAPGGTLAIVAECPDGIGPLQTVNEAILRIGVLPRLPLGAKLKLISSLDEALVKQTLVEYAPSIEALLDTSVERVVVIPRASQLICEPSS